MRLRLNLYRGNGVEKLSTEDAKQGKESFTSASLDAILLVRS